MSVNGDHPGGGKDDRPGENVVEPAAGFPRLVAQDPPAETSKEPAPPLTATQRRAAISIVASRKSQPSRPRHLSLVPAVPAATE